MRGLALVVVLAFLGGVPDGERGGREAVVVLIGGGLRVPNVASAAAAAVPGGVDGTGVQWRSFGDEDRDAGKSGLGWGNDEGSGAIPSGSVASRS